MISLEEAREKILAAVPRLPARETPLAEAMDRPIAEVLLSPLDLPPFDNSSMDGYAVRASGLLQASPDHPVALRIADRLPAGTDAEASLVPGTCARIFTGSMLPPGADAVVMQEDVEVNENGTVVFKEEARPWENIRFRGEDIKKGAALTKVPYRLTPQRAALLAAVGTQSIRVQPAPLIGLLATGDELREPGEPLAPGLIYESNRIALAGLAERCRAKTRKYPLVRDTLEATKTALEKAFAECDAVVTSGGVSVGELDFVKAAFTELGGELDFWKVAIKPGKPFVFGKWNGKFLFGLPGNPVSAFVTFYLLVCPALLKMQGHSDPKNPARQGTLVEPLENPGDRRHFVRVVVSQKKEVRLAGPQASHRLASLAGCNGLVDVPPQTTLAAGTTVNVLYWQAA